MAPSPAVKPDGDGFAASSALLLQRFQRTLHGLYTRIKALLPPVVQSSLQAAGLQPHRRRISAAAAAAILLFVFLAIQMRRPPNVHSGKVVTALSTNLSVVPSDS